MKTFIWRNLKDQEKILRRNNISKNNKVSEIVTDIINKVKATGDQAIHEYNMQFDQVTLDNMLVHKEEFIEANDLLPESDKTAIKMAINNIKLYHEKSKPVGFEYQHNEITLGKCYRPIEKVGLYIPGGTAPLVSTVMMLAIPAKIAGCKTRIMTTPAGIDGTINPAILFAAQHAGIDTIYKVGGAQAIAGMAFGTNTIPQVNKIFGPGNKYVTEAKMQVASMQDGPMIDMPAGPSEVLVIADNNANPRYIASDLLAQAEHDPLAHTVLVTPSIKLASLVEQEIKLQTNYLSRKTIIEQSLDNSIIVITDSLEECFTVSNQYAPEHLILHITDAKKYLNLVVSAGSVFIGEFSPESAGDYASGTNHVLPTYGYAKMYSGLDVSHFMKGISYQELSKAGLMSISNTVTALATLEGLDAHRNAVTIRLAETCNN